MIGGGSLHSKRAKSVPWIETDSGDMGEASARGKGFEYVDRVEGYPGSRK